LLKYRAEHIEEINRKSTYKVINIKERDDNTELDSELQLWGGWNDEADLDSVLQTRVQELSDEMSKLQKTLVDFKGTCGVEFKQMGKNIESMH
jgi:hypothetical protein